jgi:excisionase family DNA binding protein
MEKLLCTTREAAEALGIGRSKVYELMYAGVLASVKIGRSRRIPAEALLECVEALKEPAA